MTQANSASQYGECSETFYGLYPGVAEKVKDPEGKGRITVKLQWISDSYETRYAPVAQSYAGDGYGAVWIPEKGDQVIVAFLRGALNSPIVLGSIYSGVRLPHATRSEDADPKVLRTKGGHMLLMEDQSGKRIELVDLTSENSVVLDSENNSITLRAKADVTIQAGGSLTISADGGITISAGSDVTITGTTINLN
jgi:uncharacterized protein involved in type VI secretion and phage assembly